MIEYPEALARVERLMPRFDAPMETTTAAARPVIGIGLRAIHIHEVARELSSRSVVGALILLRTLADATITLRWMEKCPKLHVRLWLADDDRIRLKLADRHAELRRRRGFPPVEAISPALRGRIERTNRRFRAIALRHGVAIRRSESQALVPTIADRAAAESELWEAHDMTFSFLSNWAHIVCGIRLITYLESEARRAEQLLRGVFAVDASHSEDKAKGLGADRVGYRSIHLVCLITPERAQLPEWSRFDQIRFEIQIRTILQHAWAEFEHDRGYKFGGGKLPDELQRRLKLAAGLLEIADREFDVINADVEEYSASLSANLELEPMELGNVALDGVNVREWLLTHIPEATRAGLYRPDWPSPSAATLAIEELDLFGVRSIGALEDLIPQDYDERLMQYQAKSSPLGSLRDFMIVADHGRYFSEVWRRSWESWGDGAVAVLSSYGVPIGRIERRHNVRRDPGDDE